MLENNKSTELNEQEVEKVDGGSRYVKSNFTCISCGYEETRDGDGGWDFYGPLTVECPQCHAKAFGFIGGMRAFTSEY